MAPGSPEPRRSPSSPRAPKSSFTTNLSGYQEVFTDPSYLGQLVVMTAPMIGNYGINSEDVESDRPRVAGVVVRELSLHHSNWRSTGSLLDWLSQSRVPLIADVDTRRLTRHIRSKGAMRGALALGETPDDAGPRASGRLPRHEWVGPGERRDHSNGSTARAPPTPSITSWRSISA